MEEALYDVPLYREFAGLDRAMTRLPDETTILRFRHLLEAHGIAAQILAVVNEILSDKGLMLKAGSAVDATLIAAPSSTKNGSGTRDPEMQPIPKGRNWYFGMKAHVGVNAESGLVHAVIGTAANLHDINVDMRCCTEKRRAFMLTPVTRASKSVSRRARLDGTLRCGPASEGS